MLTKMSENFICSNKVQMYFTFLQIGVIVHEHFNLPPQVLLCNSTSKFHYAAQTTSFSMQVKLQVSIHFLRNLEFHQV